MPMKETAVIFGKNKNLVGVVTLPDKPIGNSPNTGVIILNSGILHRVGPNRLSVKIARNVAKLDVPCLRFDFSGIGDSNNQREILSLEKKVIRETQTAMDFLLTLTGTDSFIVLGICSGADIAFRTAKIDSRIVGAVLIDFFAYTSFGYYFHSYKKRLFQPRSWVKLIQGESQLWNSFKKTLSFIQYKKNDSSQEWQIPSTTETSDNVKTLVEKGIKLLFIYSGGSPSYYNYQKKFKKRFLQLEAANLIKTQFLENSDHGFTLIHNQNILLQKIQQWFNENLVAHRNKINDSCLKR